MENNKRLNQAFLILISSICIIGLLLIYSYKYKFNNNNINNIEKFTDTEIIKIHDKDIINLNLISENLNTLNKYKSILYNIYDPDIVNKYKDKLKLSDDIHKFDNYQFSNDFYQKLQNSEIDELQNNYDILEKELSNILDKQNKNIYNNVIKHITSGTVFKINGYNDKTPDSIFNIILNSDNSMCLEFKSIDPDYIDKSLITDIINNINRVPCDYADINSIKLSEQVVNTIKRQKFKAIKINNNTEYNQNLHSIYEAYKIPIDIKLSPTDRDFSDTLNNFPYYIIKPANDNDNMCLTIKQGMISIEPCDGSSYQKFDILKL
jgi:hypothetical protein